MRTGRPGSTRSRPPAAASWRKSARRGIAWPASWTRCSAAPEDDPMRLPRPTSRLREWLDRLLGTLRARRADADLQAELQSHLAFATEAGRSDRAPVTQAMDALRDRRGLPWLHALAADVVFGWRQLASRPVVSGAAILSLGLAI